MQTSAQAGRLPDQTIRSRQQSRNPVDCVRNVRRTRECPHATRLAGSLSWTSSVGNDFGSAVVTGLTPSFHLTAISLSIITLDSSRPCSIVLAYARKHMLIAFHSRSDRPDPGTDSSHESGLSAGKPPALGDGYAVLRSGSSGEFPACLFYGSAESPS
ncbi:hypothetical protein BDV59DRAFT_72798 [Aspergillus ambiguus]|uniref:uncharacterized protein n=1 Tax=Aspergillus ambiguus TaxID=176160 RepID=UPI003CCD09E6